MRQIAQLAARLAEVEQKLALASRAGTVAEVDAAQGLVRLKLGASSAGGDLLSPWVPYAQVGGALKVHSPPSVGQQMALQSPSGDLAQGLAIPMGFSSANPSPSGDGAAHVITFGAATISLNGSGLSVVMGGVTFSISASGVAITGGNVTHNGLNIGSTHTHGGVIPGGAQTSGPS
jgi:phage baseplate assembly protein gpV